MVYQIYFHDVVAILFCSLVVISNVAFYISCFMFCISVVVVVI